jgi:ribonuclease D
MFCIFAMLLQVSNWDARPLTARQIQYASLDAHSMLAILDRISADMNCPECWTGAAAEYSVGEGLRSGHQVDEASSASASASADDTSGAAGAFDWRAYVQ